WGSNGSGPGQMYDVVAIAVGPSGDVYVADRGSQRIERFDPDGNYLGQFGGPANCGIPTATGPSSGVAVDASGNVFVADDTCDKIHVFDANGSFLQEWGSWGRGAGQFNDPTGMVFDA